MLPSLVPNSRIMAYNYDSKWNWDAPKTRLELCGEDLVICLHSFRQREGIQDRPILFIGHSLGGLVIEYVRLEVYILGNSIRCQSLCFLLH